MNVTHKTKISFSGDHCGFLLKRAAKTLNVQMCKHFVSLCDPIPGQHYVGICGLFVKYLKTESAYGSPVKRCYACRKVYKDSNSVK